jgi:hypothetical protein
MIGGLPEKEHAMGCGFPMKITAGVYSTPQCEKFDDMADQLLLDKIDDENQDEQWASVNTNGLRTPDSDLERFFLSFKDGSPGTAESVDVQYRRLIVVGQPVAIFYQSQHLPRSPEIQYDT